MKEDLAQKAVSAALSGNWEEAVRLNEELVSNNPNDIDALNRLAKAFAESGKIDSAKKTSKKVLELDPFNTIASKCVNKWSGIGNGHNARSVNLLTEDFIEEPGRTKIVTLMHVGPQQLLNTLDSGDEVKLNPHGHRLSVVTSDGKYVGKLPDDIAARLKSMIKMGNAYSAVIKSISDDQVKVFVRETQSCTQLADVPSFPTEKIDYVSFTPPEFVHKKEDIELHEEEDVV
jgi:tetratricopeptide (TPR) repeat protein